MSATSLRRRVRAVAGVTDVVVAGVVDSTNLQARRRAAAGAGPGLVVVAERQTAGRGRRGRTWQDVAGGNVALSVVVAVPAAPSLLPLAAALALREVMAARDLATSLKWPNDVRVVVDGVPRKCAGILVEALAPQAPALAVVGVGVDVDWRDRPRSGATASWTSLAEAAGAPVDRDDLVVDLVASLDRWTHRLVADPAGVHAAYREACATIGRQVRVDLGDESVAGQAVGLDESGALLVATPTGRRTITAGDLVHLREP